MPGPNPTVQWVRYHWTPAMFNLPLVIFLLVISYSRSKCSQLTIVGQIQSLNQYRQFYTLILNATCNTNTEKIRGIPPPISGRSGLATINDKSVYVAIQPHTFI
jgi:hypothetical protein